ncbi:MAG: hypothetical protein R3292_06715 [Alcanivorax sp.]|nr:hypothetical protein [Alcanivorax sp.]
MKKYAALLLAIMPCLAGASTLVTPHYIIRITSQCAEGEVSCDQVRYVGTSKQSGKRITLTGSTWHTRGRDGSPGRFLGYRFRNGDVTYYVSEVGELSVVRDRTDVLIDERGEWARQPGE